MLTAIKKAIRFALGRVWPGRPLSETPGILWAAGRESTAGETVDEQGALSLSAVFAAVNLYSQVVGSLPLHVYRRWGRAKEHALTHPAYRLLHTSPNSEMTSYSARRALEWNRLLGGNAYAEIVWAGNGKPAAYYPVEYQRVRHRRRDDGSLYYQVDRDHEVEPEDMLHVPLISSDGVTGRSFLDYATESLGLGIATQTHAAAWFGNGARPGVVLENPANLTREQRAEFRAGWDERHKGPRKGGGTAVLWGGWKWVGVDGQVDPERSQLLEQRRFTAEEVARWLNIPPHLLRELSRATFSNIEHQGIDFLVYSLAPVLAGYEQEFDRKLLSPPQCYSKHSVNGLLRGDSAARSAFYREMINIGVMSVNEAREFEDWNPVDGGDVHFFPLNMAPLSKVANPPEPPPSPVPEPSPTPALPAPAPALRALLEGALERLAKVEANAVRRAAEKPGRFLDWLDGYYPAHEARLTEALGPVLEVCAPGLPPASLASSWCGRSRAELLGLADKHPAKTFPGAAEALLGGWAARPKEVANEVMGAEPCQNT